VATGYNRDVLWNACTSNGSETIDEEEIERIVTMQLVACATWIIQLPERERKLMSKTFSVGTKVEILNSSGSVDTNSDGRETSGHWVVTETLLDYKRSKVQNLLDGRTVEVSNTDLRMYYPEFCCDGSMERECVKWMDKIFSERRAAEARWGFLPMSVQTVSLQGRAEAAWFETHMMPKQSAVFSSPFLKDHTKLSAKRHTDVRFRGLEYLVASESHYPKECGDSSRSSSSSDENETNGLVQLYAFVLLQPAIVYISFYRPFKEERGDYWPGLDPHRKKWWLQGSSSDTTTEKTSVPFLKKDPSSLEAVIEGVPAHTYSNAIYFSSYQRGDTVIIFGDPSCGMVLGDGFHVYVKRQHPNASLTSRAFTSTHNQVLGAYVIVHFECCVLIPKHENTLHTYTHTYTHSLSTHTHIHTHFTQVLCVKTRHRT